MSIFHLYFTYIISLHYTRIRYEFSIVPYKNTNLSFTENCLFNGCGMPPSFSISNDRRYNEFIILMQRNLLTNAGILNINKLEQIIFTDNTEKLYDPLNDTVDFTISGRYVNKPSCYQKKTPIETLNSNNKIILLIYK